MCERSLSIRAYCLLATSRGHSAMPANNSPQPVPEDLVTVREAAQAVGVMPSMVHSWIKSGRLAAQPGDGVRLVSQAAVRALVAPRVSQGAVRALVAPPDSHAPADAVAIYKALRLTDVTRSTVVAWVRQGRLPSWRGRYGPLVRVADVQALAQQRAMTVVVAGDGTPLPPDAVSVRDAARQVGVTKGRLYTWTKQGLLPVWLVPGSGQRVRLADVTVLAERHAPAMPFSQEVRHEQSATAAAL